MGGGWRGGRGALLGRGGGGGSCVAARGGGSGQSISRDRQLLSVCRSIGIENEEDAGWGVRTSM